MFEEGARPAVATAAKEAILSKIAHRCRILHCQAEPNSGVVYMKCGDEEDASVAFKNLHGWWYVDRYQLVQFTFYGFLQVFRTISNSKVPEIREIPTKISGSALWAAVFN